jgi:hypothetical protein
MNAERAAEVRAKLMARVEVDSNLCYLWTGARTKGGYANLRHDGGYAYGHRLSYEVCIGPIPEGLDIDHLCRVRHCINSEHLEAVTHAVNLERARAAKRRVA